MVFESLSDKLNKVFKSLRGKGKLSEADIKAAMREVKLALLEADVNFKVVKAFVAAVSERAVGADVMESLTPGQQVIKIVHEELIALMGETNAKLTIAPKPPTVVMMVGLQGSGKTTHSAKLAGLMKKQGKRPLLVACDIYRPAAVKQLQVVGEQVGVPVFSMEPGTDAVTIAKNAVAHAKEHQNDMVFIDTAGRLHIDEVLMEELKRIRAAVEPTEILLAVDAMTGQDAVNVAESFNEALEIDGVVLTKMDGDTRGGAALSVRYITGKPIKFVGTGEKLDQIEPFYPDRMASRILGMGDMLTLIEKAQEQFDEKQAKELERKIREQRFDLNDFLSQLAQMKNMGNLTEMLSMVPGVNAGALKNVEIDDRQLARTEAIILSMTPKEREKPEIINAQRRQRIAAGCGLKVEDVNRLLKQFQEMQKMVKQMTGGLGRFKKRGGGKRRFLFR